jgi:DnaJ-class molecular chaperone
MPRDHYALLGVARDAPPAAIKRAYRRLAKRLHPDSGAGSSTEFLALQEAYETLSDAERRRRYDEVLQEAEAEWLDPPPHVWGPPVVAPRPAVPRGSLSGEILLSADEAAAGGWLPLDVPVEASCPGCLGSGGLVFGCDRCGGEGVVARRLQVPLRIPSGIRDGSVFQLSLDDPAGLSLLLTVHIRAL